MPPTESRVLDIGIKFAEMGISRGGKIIQKIYPDPHGLDVWQAEPSATLVIYLVNAKVFQQITGQRVPEPVGHEMYLGHWFGMNDFEQGDIPGTQKLSGLKSAVFSASDLKGEDGKSEQAAVSKEP